MRLVNAAALAISLLGFAIARTEDRPTEMDAQYLAYFGQHVGPAKMAEVAPLSRFYVCLMTKERVLIGHAMSWSWRHSMFSTVSGTTVKIRQQGAYFWVRWPNGKLIRFGEDYSRAEMFRDRRCNTASGPRRQPDATTR